MKNLFGENDFEKILLMLYLSIKNENLEFECRIKKQGAKSNISYIDFKKIISYLKQNGYEMDNINDFNQESNFKTIKNTTLDCIYKQNHRMVIDNENIENFCNKRSYDKSFLKKEQCIIYLKDEKDITIKHLKDLDNKEKGSNIILSAKSEINEQLKISLEKKKKLQNLNLTLVPFQNKNKNQKCFIIKPVINDYQITFDLKHEKKIKEKYINKFQNFRLKKRFTFRKKGDNYFKIDLTIVRSTFNNQNIYFNKYEKKYKNILETSLFTENETFEIEIELDNDKVNKKTKIKDLIQKLHQHLKILYHLVNDTEHIINNEETIIIKKQLQLLVNNTINKSLKRWFIETFIEPKNKTEIENLIKNEKYDTYFKDPKDVKRLNDIKKNNLFISPCCVSFEQKHLDSENDVNITTSEKNDVFYTVTDKADGEASLLFINDNNECFLINKNLIVTRFINEKIKLKNVLLNGELIITNSIKTFLAFDCYIYDNIDYTKQPFILIKGDKYKGGIVTPADIDETRYTKLRDIERIWNLELKNQNKFFISKFYPENKEEKEKGNIFYWSKHIWKTFINNQNTELNNFKEYSHKFEDETGQIIDYKYNYNNNSPYYKLDGLIYTPGNKPVGWSKSQPKNRTNISNTWNYNLKWKPKHENTLDLFVEILDKEYELDDIKYKELHLYCGKFIYNDNCDETSMSYKEKVLFQPISPVDKNAYIAYIKLTKNGNLLTQEGDLIKDGTIVEFEYKKDETSIFKWIPKRNRYDKINKYKKKNGYKTTNFNNYKSMFQLPFKYDHKYRKQHNVKNEKRKIIEILIYILNNLDENDKKSHYIDKLNEIDKNSVLNNYNNKNNYKNCNFCGEKHNKDKDTDKYEQENICRINNINKDFLNFFKQFKQILKDLFEERLIKTDKDFLPTFKKYKFVDTSMAGTMTDNITATPVAPVTVPAEQKTFGDYIDLFEKEVLLTENKTKTHFHNKFKYLLDRNQNNKLKILSVLRNNIKNYKLTNFDIGENRFNLKILYESLKNNDINVLLNVKNKNDMYVNNNYGNMYDTCNSIWSSIHNPVDEDLLLHCLTDFHGIVKFPEDRTEDFKNNVIYSTHNINDKNIYDNMILQIENIDYTITEYYYSTPKPIIVLKEKIPNNCLNKKYIIINNSCNSKIEEKKKYYNRDYTVPRNKSLTINLQIYHNKIKNILLQKNIGEKKNIKILDLACGKGGDIAKWISFNKNNNKKIITNVIGIDKNDDNINNDFDGACSRVKFYKNKFVKFADLIPDIYFLKADLQKKLWGDAIANEKIHNNKIEIFKKIFQDTTKPPSFNLISINFAFHYFFENELSVNNILENINSNLSTDGIVYATCFDKESILNLFKKITKNKEKVKDGLLITKKYIIGYKNSQEIWKIEKLFSNTYNKFLKINFWSHSIGTTNSEYLVDFTYLKEEVTKHSLEFITTQKNFDTLKIPNNNNLSVAEKALSDLYVYFELRKKSITVSKSDSKNTLSTHMANNKLGDQQAEIFFNKDSKYNIDDNDNEKENIKYYLMKYLKENKSKIDEDGLLNKKERDSLKLYTLLKFYSKLKTNKENIIINFYKFIININRPEENQKFDKAFCEFTEFIIDENNELLNEIILNKEILNNNINDSSIFYSIFHIIILFNKNWEIINNIDGIITKIGNLIKKITTEFKFNDLFNYKLMQNLKNGDKIRNMKELFKKLKLDGNYEYYFEFIFGYLGMNALPIIEDMFTSKKTQKKITKKLQKFMEKIKIRKIKILIVKDSNLNTFLKPYHQLFEITFF